VWMTHIAGRPGRWHVGTATSCRSSVWRP
jgi:hypothetical protein